MLHSFTLLFILFVALSSESIVTLSDNTAVKCVDVIIDGKSVATYAQKEIEKAGGKISYMIEGASEPQKIEAAALDMAGNETTSEMHKVLVTSSVWIQYINNTPLLISAVFLSASDFLFAFFFLFSDHKEPDRNKENKRNVRGPCKCKR